MSEVHEGILIMRVVECDGGMFSFSDFAFGGATLLMLPADTGCELLQLDKLRAVELGAESDSWRGGSQMGKELI